jgi:hypothetical protein
MFALTHTPLTPRRTIPCFSPDSTIIAATIAIIAAIIAALHR